MKNDTKPVITTGNFVATESVTMGFDEGGLGHIMSILSNMYADSYEAVLREYSANGYDSHVESGQTRPIEVTLPTHFAPSLLIQDFGLGMSKETMLGLYSTYGKSTKGDSNDSVGGFGIGSKSAFTMGSQFIVTAVKDGQLTSARFALNEDNVGEAEILGEGPTDKPNGVLVVLAVEDIERMRETAARVFSTWDPETVLVDGEKPVSIFDRAIPVNDEVCLVPDHEGRIFVTLGPVAYPVSKRQMEQVVKVLGEDPAATTARTLLTWAGGTTSLFFRANVGDMQIAPNREMLRDTRDTVHNLAAKVTGLHQDLAESVQARVDKATSHYQAALVLHEALTDIQPLTVDRKVISHQGLQGIKRDVKVTLTKYSLVNKTHRSVAKVVQTYSDMTVDAVTAPKVVVVTGVPEAEWGGVRRYTKRFIENNEWGVEHVMVTEATAASFGWFQFGVPNGVRTMTRDEYRAALKTMSNFSPRMHNEPSYSTGIGATASRDLSDREPLSDILSWGQDIVVFEDRAPSGDLAAAVLKDYTVVVTLATQSLPALLKRVKEADAGVEVIEDFDYNARATKVAEKRLKKVTDKERAALGAGRWLADNQVDRSYGTVADWKRYNDLLVKHAVVDMLPEYEEIMETIELVRLVAADITEDRKREFKYLTDFLGGKSALVPTFDYVIPTLHNVYPLLAVTDAYNLSRNPKTDLFADVVEYLVLKNS